ncbi:Hydantoinase B/oxoprolinase [Zopfochytrium polystomum]|nr:Hydantoinase B/oxoprolinase [Zopfochytrium polystomum]
MWVLPKPRNSSVQVAANQRGIALVKDLIQEYGLDVVQAYMDHIRGNAELAVRNLLKDFAKTQGRHVEAEDYMDDGSTIRLSIAVDEATGNAIFDFTGTSPEVKIDCSSPSRLLSTTIASIIYCLRCLVNLDMPLNQGALQPITFVIPEGSMVCPSETAAVVGGSVLTSQRLCDVILRAFKVAAPVKDYHKIGCCNNFTFGSGGKDEAGNVKAGFGYYETIAGGSGAGPTWDGRSGVHTHMTNTRITDPEILERRYPVILRKFSLREGSGGDGLYKGGDGVIREVEFLEPLNVSLLSERRVFAPYGQSGGCPGKRGLKLLIRAGRKEAVNFGGKNATVMRPGDRIRIETPGGGGFGAPPADAAAEDDGGVKKRITEEVAGHAEVDALRRVGGGSLGNLMEAERDF